MKTAPAAMRRMCRTRALRRSPTGMGTRKTASVSPRSAAVVRSSLGMAIVIGTPVEGHYVSDHAAESSIGSLEVDGPHDRELAGDTRRILRRKHRDADPEDDAKRERKPRDPAS